MQDYIKHIVTSDQMAEQCHRDIVAMVKEFGWCNIEIKAGGRSEPQRKTYWMWLQEAAEWMTEHSKYDINKDDLHDRMRVEFLGMKEDRMVGTTKIPGQLISTGDLTKGEMFHYMTQVEQFWLDRGCPLTTPGDSQYMKLKRSHASGDEEV